MQKSSKCVTEMQKGYKQNSCKMVAEENIWVWERGIETCCVLSRNEGFYNLLFKGSNEIKEDGMDRPCSISGGCGIQRVLI